jgi:hypothetical protein
MKLSDYLTEQLPNGTTIQSASRLCAFWGLCLSAITTFAIVGAWIAVKDQPSWPLVALSAVPGIIGILPLLFKYAKQVVDSGKVETIITAYEHGKNNTTSQIS